MRSLLRLLNKYSYVLVFLLLESLAILLLSNHNHYQHSKILNTNREITGWIFDKVDGTREYLSLKKTNEILVRENATLRNMLSAPVDADIDHFQNKEHRTYYFAPARIVHSSVYKQFNYLTINKGRKQGVIKDMAVIGEEGIVGIVLESSPNFSTVLPLINRDFRLSAKIEKNNFAGIIQWDGNSPQQASLNEIPYHADVQIGDTIVTSGFSSIFPEGLHVGTVSEFSLREGNFFEIYIQLGTNFSTLFHVNIIKNFLQEEQLELEENTDK
jgi:rod shape-determining protein MreC